MRGLVRYVPHSIVFATSMGIMIVELVASRLVAKYLGNSLFTWTSVIGVVLGGISLGNWLGGRLADRFKPRALIPVLLLASSLLTFLVIALDLAVSRITRVLGVDVMTMSLLVRSILLIVSLFFLPSCALGTISPVMAKYALEGTSGIGKTVGGMYAFGSLGSIAGTFLAGYVLIPRLGLTMNVLAVGIALALLSLAMGGKRIFAGTWLIVLALVTATGAPQALARRLIADPEGRKVLVFSKDSPYSYIQVTDTRYNGDLERTLRLDALIHNRYDPNNRDALLYEYERIFASLTVEAAGASAGAFSTLTIGGGGFTLPAYLERHYPSARHEVVEIDPEVIETAYRFFDLPRDTAIRIATADARIYVDSVRGKKLYDIVYCDAFNAYSVPTHLTTKEFVLKIAEILSPDGIYMTNCIDILDSGGFLNAYINTLRSVFPQVSAYMSPDSAADTRSTFVVVAGEKLIAADVLLSADGTVAGKRMQPEMMADLRMRNGEAVLTDDHAPVETLMAPVFLRSVK